MKEKKFKNLIFDLGGVIINLQPNLTIKELQQYGYPSSEFTLEKIMERKLFLEYEVGLISDETFRKELSTILSHPISDEELDRAWCGMLLDYPTERIDLLKRLRKDHRMFLLSNTNAIHIKKANEILYKEHGIADLGSLFDKVYYSHVLQKRKPNVDIFEHILNENELVAEETLFIDDSAANVAAAATLNIGTLHITSDKTLINYFNGEYSK